MHKFLVITLFVFSFISQWALAQKSEVRKMAAFNSVYFFGNMEVKLIKSDSNSIVITSQNIDPQSITMSVENGQLLVRNMAVGKDNGIIVILYYNDINEIIAKAGVDLEVKGKIENAIFSVRLSKGAKANLQIFSDSLNLISNQGSNLIISGKSNHVIASANSGATIDAFKLFTKTAQIHSVIGASISIAISDSLMAEANTGGSIKYKGEPIILSQKVITGGKILKENI